MKRLTDNYESFNSTLGHEWMGIVSRALRPVVNRAIKNDVSLRDVELLVNREIAFLVTMEVLTRKGDNPITQGRTTSKPDRRQTTRRQNEKTAARLKK